MHDEIIRDLDGSPAILGSDAGALAGTKPANLTLLFLRLWGVLCSVLSSCVGAGG
jgi:hypothetical protein